MNATRLARIAWVDDEEAVFDAFNAQWPEGTGYALEFWQFDAVAHDNGEALDQLAKDPPEVLLLDWQEGGYERIYQVLRDKVSATVIKSVDPQDMLATAGVYAQYPELAQRTLQWPFKVDALRALLPPLKTFVVDEVQPSANVLHWLKQRLSAIRMRSPEGTSPAQSAAESAQPVVDFSDRLPVRYLNADFVAIAKSAAWRESLNRPESTWPAKAQVALMKGEPWTHLDFGVNPGDPDDFGLMQYTTVKLTRPGTVGASFQQAHFAQWVTAISDDLMNPDTGGLSKYGASISGILELMRQAGFQRGRFYRVTEISGLSSPLLELVVLEPSDPKVPPLPVAVEIDYVELAEFSEHVKEFSTNGKGSLTYKVRRELLTKPNSPNDDNIWDRYVPDVGAEARLEVPVFESKAAAAASTDSRKLHPMIGMLIFDLGGPGAISERLEKAVKKPLLIALKYFQEARRSELAGFERRRAEALQKFHVELAREAELPGLEKLLSRFALELLNSDSPDTLGIKTSAPDRSAMFVRFDDIRQCLKVTADTDGLMCGFGFPLTLDRFILVNAANAALELLRQNPEANIAPLLVPDVEGHYRVTPERQITEDDWLAVQGCGPDQLAQCQAWLKEKVKAVVACSVVSGGRLLGVLVVRSSNPFEFTRRRVDTLNLIAAAGTPYLARLHADAHRSEWVGMVMHEMRSHLSRTQNKMDRALYAAEPSARDQYLADAALILKSGYGLSQLFLQWQGVRDGHEGAATDAAHWHEIDSYGQACERGQSSMTWCFEYSSSQQGKGAALLARVLMILLDNAFRYADLKSAHKVVSCRICDNGAGSGLIIEISNPGTAHLAELTTRDQPVRSRVGLTLARRACSDMRGTLEFSNELAADGQSPIVVARVCWPGAGQ